MDLFSFRGLDDVQAGEVTVRLIDSVQINHAYVRTRLSMNGFLYKPGTLNNYTESGGVLFKHGPFEVAAMTGYVDVFLHLTQDHIEAYQEENYNGESYA